MVRLSSPLFSEKAQKQLGKKLIYKRKGSKNLLTKYNKPGGVAPFTPSTAQQIMRLVYTCAIAKWRALSDAARKAWDDLAKKKNLKMSGWNYFYKLIIPACALEVCDYPAESDVVKNVEYGKGEYKGTSDKGLPWTGQTIIYQPGDDGTYEKGHTTNRPIVKGVGSHRFVDNGDGTITDKATGLMWIADPINDLGGLYAATQNWTTAVGIPGFLTFAGNTDWRLPNEKELASIIDYANRNPCLDATFFPNTQLTYYWSSTTRAIITERAWAVMFSRGDMFAQLKTDLFWIRPVRLGKP